MLRVRRRRVWERLLVQLPERPTPAARPAGARGRNVGAEPGAAAGWRVRNEGAARLRRRESERRAPDHGRRESERATAALQEAVSRSSVARLIPDARREAMGDPGSSHTHVSGDDRRSRGNHHQVFSFEGVHHVHFQEVRVRLHRALARRRLRRVGPQGRLRPRHGGEPPPRGGEGASPQSRVVTERSVAGRPSPGTTAGRDRSSRSERWQRDDVHPHAAAGAAAGLWPAPELGVAAHATEGLRDGEVLTPHLEPHRAQVHHRPHRRQGVHGAWVGWSASTPSSRRDRLHLPREPRLALDRRRGVRAADASAPRDRSWAGVDRLLEPQHDGREAVPVHHHGLVIQRFVAAEHDDTFKRALHHSGAGLFHFLVGLTTLFRTFL